MHESAGVCQQFSIETQKRDTPSRIQSLNPNRLFAAPFAWHGSPLSAMPTQLVREPPYDLYLGLLVLDLGLMAFTSSYWSAGCSQIFVPAGLEASVALIKELLC